MKCFENAGRAHLLVKVEPSNMASYTSVPMHFVYTQFYSHPPFLFLLGSP